MRISLSARAALARLFAKYAPRRVVRGPNQHHAGGRSRTGGIPWVGRKRSPSR